jgi:flavin-dependent dehydrogenase
MVNPLTGEGIYNAMVSGEIAANVIREALETGATNENVLMSYQTLWRNDFGIDFKRFFKLSKLWDIKKENIVRLFGKDEKLVDIALKHITDTDTIKKYRWKLARRFLYIYLKNRFGL